MKTQTIRLNFLFLLTLFSAILFSCQKETITEATSDDAENTVKSTTQAYTVTADIAGRNLAANCFQCHGTNGYAGELKIAEQSASSIIGDMNEMKSKDPGENIMNVHARAYTADEIQLIGEFFSKQ
jgi:sulfide dehydrogenase cytochrome subunit